MAYYYSPFRNKYKKKQSGCPFCNVQNITKETVRLANGRLAENEHYRWVVNMFPKFEGHTLVIPKKHITQIGSESAEEIIAREKLVSFASSALRSLYPGSGIEIFLQTGEGSEASVQHLHWHVVPALPEDPLRGFDKMGHFFTIEPDKEKVVIFPVKIRRAKIDLLKALTKVLPKSERTPNESHIDGRRKRHKT